MCYAFVWKLDEKHWETLGFSCNFNQSECSIQIPQAFILHVFSSVHWLSFYYSFYHSFNALGFFCLFFKLLAKSFLLPTKKIFTKQGKMDCPVIPGAHISFRSSGCCPLLVMNPATVAKSINHIRINCKTGPAIIFSLALPRNWSKKW